MGRVGKEKLNINKMKLMLSMTVGGFIGNLVDLFPVPLNNQKLLCKTEVSAVKEKSRFGTLESFGL